MKDLGLATWVRWHSYCFFFVFLE